MDTTVPPRVYLTGKSAETIRANMWRYRLTQRQRLIAWEYIHGRPYKEIAQMLGCPVHTVRSHLYVIRQRCGFDVMAGQGSGNPIRLLRLLAGVAPVVYTSTLEATDVPLTPTNAPRPAA